ncbi:hypothetical protein [Paenibacillus sp. J22TS3]|uniref:hypothetical protein n=1 Tax=Paenibacillus sp. J22TS3 TaxID=2807192 RepID=UPI001B1FF40E|nr:hypothetical protein [Paenibacillus sp. J22TS3]GIP21062.1 hypothetical protein J22TS3_13370 [Paenibacillus sp. J22TS3]
MKLDTNYSQLVEMKAMSWGNPERIAAYTLAQRRYDDTVAHYFDEESGVKFMANPSQSYVEGLEAKAAETGNDDDKARAIIARDQFEHYEKDRVKHIAWQVSRQNLRRLLVEGGKVTRKDVDEAHRIAKLNATMENLAVYSQIKQKFGTQEGSN